MGRYLLRRIPQTLLVLLGVITMAFFMTHVVPGDPARLIAGVCAALASTYPDATSAARPCSNRRRGTEGVEGILRRDAIIPHIRTETAS